MSKPENGTDVALRKVRLACVQYPMRRVTGFDDFAEQVSYFVEAAGADYGAEFVVFPEFLSAQLLSALPPMDPREGIRELSEFTERFVDLMSRLAQQQQLHLIAGSHPLEGEDGELRNTAMIFCPDGSRIDQAKLHITPWEKEAWNIVGGNSLVVIETPKARVGVLICYDVEFPEAVRHLADQGIHILFVPYCTDDRQGHLRVNTCAAARAIENQIYVATAGVVGNLPGVPEMNIHYARSAVFTPCDFDFARDGIQARADTNIEALLVTDVDLAALERARRSGTVRPMKDRRSDLFGFHCEL